MCSAGGGPSDGTNFQTRSDGKIDTENSPQGRGAPESLSHTRKKRVCALQTDIMCIISDEITEMQTDWE